jgi:predicted GH43/DUF377 family glycosyl hydrolase
MRRFLTILNLVMLFGGSIFNSSFAQIPWTKDARNPIMSGGADGTWNRHVFTPSVLYNPDSTRYEMWFGASSGPDAQNNWNPIRIGFATSTDGLSWTKHAHPVLEPDAGTWDESYVDGARIIRENGQYKMWYVGSGPTHPEGGIGYATSSDGINWKKDMFNNPLIEPDTVSWEAGGYDYCYIYVLPVQGGGYKMWYAGNVKGEDFKKSIGYATSADGIAWQKDALNNPVLTTETTDKWDYMVCIPQVVLLDDVYQMWYLGIDSGWYNRKFGWATSVDGINWNKYDNPTTTSTMYSDSDPVLTPGLLQWDGDYIEPGTVMLEGDSLRMWYAGSRSPASSYLWRIGHATAPLIPTGLFEIEDIVSPDGYVLRQNYPNPFNPSTTIEFTLPKSDFVELKVFNILGKEVSTLVSNKLNQGNHTYQFDGKNLASGIYYYQLVAGDYREVKKMILLR